MLYTEGAVIAAMVYLFVPLMILTLVGVLENIPEDVVQASASLGASPAATFRQVIFPLAVPGLIVGAVLVFTGSLHLLRDAATGRRRATNGDGYVDVSARHGVVRLGRRLDDRRHHGGDHHQRGAGDEPHRQAPQPDGDLTMTSRIHPLLILFTVLVYIFLTGPLIIVFGASVSDTTYLTFPPQGLSLRWFENIFRDQRVPRELLSPALSSPSWRPALHC